jgi:hypothetical protein
LLLSIFETKKLYEKIIEKALRISMQGARFKCSGGLVSRRDSSIDVSRITRLGVGFRVFEIS